MGEETEVDGAEAAKKDLSRVATLKTYDFYKKLLPLEAGQAPKDEKEEEETKEMKMWLM